VRELSQKALGRVRDALYALEPKGEYSSTERREFWKKILFDGGLATAFTDVAATYDFNWADIIAHLHTGKFGAQNQTFATLIPPSIGEMYLNKLVVFALEQSTDTPMEEGIRESLRDDGYPISGGSQTRVPAERAELSKKEAPFDVFISHATEDNSYVEPLVSALESAGIRVWFDKTTLEWGDDLRSSIDRGLENSRFGIVIFSKAFLEKKKWTEYELNSLFALEQSRRKVILPIWHGITRVDLVQYSPSFADRHAKVSSSTDSYKDIVESLLKMLGRSKSQERSLVNGTILPLPEGHSITFSGQQLLRRARKWRAWLGGGTAIALATLVVTVFPAESHDFAVKLLHSPVTAWNWMTKREVVPKRYTSFSVTGSFQQGYSIDKDSTILIDGETGYEMDANITVLGPNGSKEVFTAKPNYGIESIYQWQNQGSLGGSLDFQFKPRTFAGFTGGKLTNSAYWTPALNHNVDSSDTILRPIATSDTPP
jgi:TIR domain